MKIITTGIKVGIAVALARYSYAITMGFLDGIFGTLNKKLGEKIDKYYGKIKEKADD